MTAVLGVQKALNTGLGVWPEILNLCLSRSFQQRMAVGLDGFRGSSQGCKAGEAVRNHQLSHSCRLRSISYEFAKQLDPSPDRLCDVQSKVEAGSFQHGCLMI